MKRKPNPFAVELGKLSAKARFKGMTKKQRSEAMSKVRSKMKSNSIRVKLPINGVISADLTSVQ